MQKGDVTRRLSSRTLQEISGLVIPARSMCFPKFLAQGKLEVFSFCLSSGLGDRSIPGSSGVETLRTKKEHILSMTMLLVYGAWSSLVPLSVTISATPISLSGTPWSRPSYLFSK